MTCSHVVAPYRWTEHFREPWLEFVKDVHIECRLQLWRVRGVGMLLNDDAAAGDWLTH